VADREPIGENDRPTGEMTDPRPAQDAPHASHDLFVIAAAADRAADATARSAAEAQMRDCAECAALFADLQALSGGLAALPRELPVPRDFRLSPEQAAALRRRGWRAVFDNLFRSPSLRPFGSALATIGFAGLLLTVGLPGLLGMGAGGSSPTAAPAAISLPAGGAPAAAGASPALAPELSTAGTGKAGASPPADTSVGNGSASQPSAAPAATSDFAYAAPSASAGSAFGATGTVSGRAAGSLAPAPIDPLAFVPWLSLGAFLVGIVLLAMARIGGRSRTGS